MQTLTALTRQKRDAPLFVRWNPEASPYTIELKLEVVEEIAGVMRAASSAQREIGGILFGRFDSSAKPLLRIEAVQFIPSQAANATAYLLNPKQYEAYQRGDDRSAQRGAMPVGMFRSHLRASTPRPSLADWTQLSSMFPRGPAAILLIQGDESSTASIFVREDQALPKQPAITPFRFEPEALGGLPELSARSVSTETGVSSWRFPKAALLATVLLCAMVALAAYAWSGSASALRFGRAENNPALAVTGSNVLTITWDRESALVVEAVSAKLLIVDGQNAREITLSSDELRSGSVQYERRNRSVQVMLVLSMPDNFSVTQSVAWHSEA